MRPVLRPSSSYPGFPDSWSLQVSHIGLSAIHSCIAFDGTCQGGTLSGDAAVAEWSREHVELVREFASQGRSSGEIAALLPGDRSRCAIVGICHRENITLHGNSGNNKTKKKQKRIRVRARKRSAPEIRHPSELHVMSPIPTAPLPLPIDDTWVPVEQRRTVLTLTSSCCRWPVGHVGDKDFHFCGATRLPGVSYCEPHARRAYQSAQPRMLQVRVAV